MGPAASAVGAAPPVGPPPPRRNTRALWGVVGAVVVAVVIGLAALSGLIPGIHPKAASTGASAPTAATAESRNTSAGAGAVASSFAANVTGGPWALYVVEGEASLTPGSVQADQWEFGGDNCTFVSGSGVSVAIPAFTGKYYSGNASGWLFVYLSSNDPARLLLVFVSDGTALEIGELSGTGCSFYRNYAAPLQSGFIGSATVASDVVSSPTGSAFVAIYGEATASYLLAAGQFDNSNLTQGYGNSSVWFVSFAACTGTTVGGLIAIVGAIVLARKEID